MKIGLLVLSLLVLSACGSREEERPAAAAATPTQPPAPAAPVGARGPFATIDAYCQTVLGAVAPARCEDPSDEGGNLCSCARADSIERRVDGPAAAAGPGAPVSEVALVAVQTSGGVDCHLAIVTPSGVYVAEGIATCGESPMAHDSGHTLTTRALRATPGANGVDVVFEWEERTQSAPDVDSPDEQWAEESAGEFRVTCTVDAAGSVRCNPRETLAAPGGSDGNSEGPLAATPCRVELEHTMRDEEAGDDQWRTSRVPVTTLRPLAAFERERYDVVDWTVSPIAPEAMTRTEVRALPNVTQHAGTLLLTLEDSSITWTFDANGRVTLADVDPTADSSVYRFHYSYDCAQ